MKLVETGFKLRFMLTFCIITITAVSMASLLFYFLTYRELSHDYGEAFSTLQSVKSAIFPLLFASIESIALLTVVSIAIAVISLFFSHKIAGPLYRFEKSMEAVGSGDLTCVVRLRAGDQFLRLEKTMCTTINSMNQRVRGIKDIIWRVGAINERLKTHLETDLQQKGLKELTEDLRIELTELKRIMATIQMEG